MANSVNNNLPLVPENAIDPAAGLNIPLAKGIDALVQTLAQTVGANSPPGSPAEGARYIVGTAPTGAWAGQANKLARYLDTAWEFYDARYALNAADGLWYVRSASTWAPLAGGGGGEANTASNLGAGEGLYASKVGVDLRFKSLVAGANVTLSSDGDTVTINATGSGGSGTVTSVALSAPTGFAVSGSPVTTTGTLALAFDTGYSLPTDLAQADWNTAFGWGDHATAGYEKQLTAGANITIDRTDPDNPVISASASSGMTNPMTTAGDVIKGGTGGTPERLAIGTAGQVLTVVGGAPAWDDLPAAGAGDVVGPASAANNGVALFDGTTGKLIKDGGVLGTAAFTASTDYATAAQGALADSATQPGDLATVATTGAYSDLSGLPTLGTAAATDATDYATAAQGALADTALQPADIGVTVQGYDAETAKLDVAQSWTAAQNFGKGTSAASLAVAASAIDLALGNGFTKTISGATTFTLSNVPASPALVIWLLELTNGGSATVTWWSGITWAEGSPPALTAAGRDLIGFYTLDGGTTSVGFVIGLDV